MPFVLIYEREGRNETQKAAVVKDITLAMAKHFNIPEHSVRIIFNELREDQIGIGGWLESSSEYKAKAKSEGFTV